MQPIAANEAYVALREMLLRMDETIKQMPNETYPEVHARYLFNLAADHVLTALDALKPLR